jgi:hypothetical protein
MDRREGGTISHIDFEMSDTFHIASRRSVNQSLNDRLMCLGSSQTQMKVNAFSQQETASVGIAPTLSILARSNWPVKHGDR